ncbi:hypothetical protein B5M09_010808 [Aphanomyces astaci]|uniref:Anaphase-promoting complex subunit 4-like WD40 domain-containing protein n=1 Tax=Aphanomyces astaci TaxID=112090 RepID=A0A3R7Y7D8_APHAT|nr:hypothetical protein B5M09_010808 [Aphanomyces astaci]
MSFAPPPAPATALPSGGHEIGRTNVSELLAHSQGIMSWSGCGRYLAVAKDTRLCVRDVTMNLSIVQLFTCVDLISAIQWAPHIETDSNSGDSMRLIFCAMYKRAIVQVFSILDPSWTCNEALNLPSFVSDFRIHATVWSLVDTSKYVIRHPKLGAEGFAFSPDGTYLAVAERSECKVRRVSSLCIFAYQHALGIKSMAWSPSGQFLALGSFDEKVRLMSHMHWKCIAELDHPTFLPSTSASSSVV